mgnify:CR=1 FL=1|jgi:hypothetical protein
MIAGLYPEDHFYLFASENEIMSLPNESLKGYFIDTTNKDKRGGLECFINENFEEDIITHIDPEDKVDIQNIQVIFGSGKVYGEFLARGNVSIRDNMLTDFHQMYFFNSDLDLGFNVGEIYKELQGIIYR